MALPGDLANRALDSAGADRILGDIEDGTRESNIVLRYYGPVRRQLLRAANWNFARRLAPMQLLGDATGNTVGVGTLVETPWTYCYALPTDCVRVRFVPLNIGAQSTAAPAGNIAPPNAGVPLFGGGNAPPAYQARLIPSRFLVTTDYNHPPQLTQGPGGVAWWEQAGISPGARTVILSNVQNANAVYTCDQIYASLWDSLFEEAFVACLAEKIALPIARDKKDGEHRRASNIAIARQCIMQARVADGDEGVTTTAREASWIRSRGAYGPDGGGLLGGYFLYGWSGYSFSDGTGIGGSAF